MTDPHLNEQVARFIRIYRITGIYSAVALTVIAILLVIRIMQG